MALPVGRRNVKERMKGEEDERVVVKTFAQIATRQRTTTLTDAHRPIWYPRRCLGSAHMHMTVRPHSPFRDRLISDHSS